MIADKTVLALIPARRAEAFGWGAKTLFANLSGDEDYDFPVSGPWGVEDPSYEEFGDRLDAVRAMSASEWDAASAKARRYVMAYDTGEPAHRYVRRLLLEGIGEEERA